MQVLTSNISRCAYYIEQSQNTMAKGNCSLAEPGSKEQCDTAGGAWTEAPSWDTLDAAAGDDGEAAPECMEMFWSRDNHLGNGVGGQPNILNWTLPKAVTNLRMVAAGNGADEYVRCVLRLRYNITTGDTGLDLVDSIAYWDLDSRYNGDDSPVEQDEAVEVPGAQNAKDGGEAGAVDAAGVTRTLQLALNTNQYGRVFEDRSMVFHIVDMDKRVRRRRLQQAADPRVNAEDGLSKDDVMPDECSEIHNLQIRGKRGNIVQSYPSVEHDFEPSPLVAETGDCIRYVMHLTDNDPPNNAGEGLPGSGRANVVLTETGDKNIPVTDWADPVTAPADLFATTDQMFRWSYLGQDSLNKDGASTCLQEDQIADNNNEQNVRNCGKLNPVGPFYDAGIVRRHPLT